MKVPLIKTPTATGLTFEKAQSARPRLSEMPSVLKMDIDVLNAEKALEKADTVDDFWDLFKEAEPEGAEPSIPELSEEEEAVGIPMTLLGLDDKNLESKRREARFKNYIPRKFALKHLRSNDEIGTEERIYNLSMLKQHNKPHEITLIHINDLGDYEYKDYLKLSKNIFKLVNRFQNLEILIMPNLGLKKISDLSLPNLVYLDLSGNAIKDQKKTVELCDRSPHIQILNLKANPVASKDGWWHPIVCALKSLRILNGKQIPLEDQVAARLKKGTHEMKSAIPDIVWDYRIMELEEIQTMPQWDPDQLTTLNLSHCALAVFHVGNMSNLTTLDLSHNKITSTLGGGLEHCEQIKRLDLSFNQLVLKNEPELTVFSFIYSLQELFLEGNPNKSDYRVRVLYATRNLPGSNRRPGLRSLDGRDVTIEDQMNALRVDSYRYKEPDLREIRWNYSLIKEYGHKQLKNYPTMLKEVKKADFSSAGLSVIDLSAFEKLVDLNLKDNSLRSLPGLENLKTLRKLDATGNELDAVAVIKQASQLPQLEELDLNDKDKDKQYKRHRHKTISELVFVCRGLRVVDRTPITVEERISAYQSLGKTPHEVEKYRFEVGLVYSAGRHPKNYHYDEVVVGRQYETESVQELLQLKGLGLVECDLSPFSNLHRLNISNNNLVDITALGLNSLVHLQILDISKNKVKNSIKEIALIIDGLKDLDYIDLSNNPCMKSPSDRTKLIGALDCMHEVECRLKFLSGPVSIAERVSAWRARGASEEEVEHLRYKSTLAWKTPKGTDSASLEELNLISCELRLVQLHEFKNLNVLLLKDNGLKDIQDLGLENCLQLRVLDLRKNKLSSVANVIKVIEKLPKLEALGLAENRLSSDYRDQIVGSMDRFHEIDCPLRYMDDVEISVDTIVQAWKSTGGSTHDVEKFRWSVITSRKMKELRDDLENQDLTESDVKVLNLSELHISSHFDLSPFSNVKKLSLAHNDVTVEGLEKSGIASLKDLEALDIGHNDVKDLAFVQQLVDDMPKLEVLFVDHNPAYVSDAENRKQFIRGLKTAAKTGMALKTLNGTDVQVDERVAALKKVLPADQVEDLRVWLVLEEEHDDTSKLTELDLSHHHLSSVGPIASLSNLEVLNLCNNNLNSLDGLRELPVLRCLDLRVNKFSSLFNLLFQLEDLNALKVLMIQDAVEGKETKKPAKYVRKVFPQLRGLASCDDFENTNPLSEEQLEAVDYLNQLAGIGPNSITHIDIAERDLKVWQLPTAVKHMAALPVQSLKARGNPWERFPNFRYYLIYHIASLEVLDDHPITLDERANALQQVKKMEEEGIPVALVNADKKPMKMPNAPSSLPTSALKGAGGTGGATGGTGTGVSNTTAINTSDDMAVAAGGFLTGAVGAAESVTRPLGTVVSKWDIVISFVQVWGLVIEFDIEWPDAFRQFSEWTSFLSLDIDVMYPSIKDIPYIQHIKFCTGMTVPIILMLLYKQEFQLDEFRRKYVRQWPKYRKRALFVYFLLVIIGGVVSFVLYPDSFSDIAEGNQPEPESLGVMITIAGGLTFLLLVYLINALIFRKKHQDLGYWYTFVGLKKKLCLFMLTVMYMPIARLILNNFTPHKVTTTVGGQTVETCVLKHYPDTPCLTEIGNFTIWQGLSIFFFFVYVIGLPVFFIRLIKAGVESVDRATLDLEYMQREVQQLEKQHKSHKLSMSKQERKASEKMLKEKKKQLANVYGCAVLDNPKPQSYLYQSYERKWRYYKVVQMIEKFALLVITLFVTKETITDVVGKVDIPIADIQAGVATVIIFFFFGFAAITRPMLDGVEDIMESFCRLTNSVNVGMGALLAFLSDSDFVKNDLASTVLFVVNTINIVIILIALFGGLIRKKLAERALAKAKANKKTSLLDDIELGALEQQDEDGSIRVAESALEKQGSKVPPATTYIDHVPS